LHQGQTETFPGRTVYKLPHHECRCTSLARTVCSRTSTSWPFRCCVILVGSLGNRLHRWLDRTGLPCNQCIRACLVDRCIALGGTFCSCPHWTDLFGHRTFRGCRGRGMRCPRWFGLSDCRTFPRGRGRCMRCPHWTDLFGHRTFRGCRGRGMRCPRWFGLSDCRTFPRGRGRCMRCPHLIDLFGRRTCLQCRQCRKKSLSGRCTGQLHMPCNWTFPFRRCTVLLRKRMGRRSRDNWIHFESVLVRTCGTECRFGLLFRPGCKVLGPQRTHDMSNKWRQPHL
jgi:hypothetical protein